MALIALGNISPFRPADMDAVLDIWLSASIKAHDFIAPEFWRAQLQAMRAQYLPSAQVFVYRAPQVLGFAALLDNSLAALFVEPKAQGRGIGRQLLDHVKAQRPYLTLKVYRENHPSIGFYQAQGFVQVAEQIDAYTGHLEWVMRYRAE